MAGGLFLKTAGHLNPEKENTMSQDKQAQIDNNFTYHAPFGDQPARYAELRAAGKKLAEEIVAKTPASREQALALTKLEEVIMWANAGIARNEKAPEQQAA